MTEPAQTVLTPAQVEVIEEMLEDRDEQIQEAAQKIHDSIAALAAQIDTLRQEVATELSTTVKWGERVALRGVDAKQHHISAIQSDFAEDVSTIRWEWRAEVGSWESFTVEQGKA